MTGIWFGSSSGELDKEILSSVGMGSGLSSSLSLCEVNSGWGYLCACYEVVLACRLTEAVPSLGLLLTGDVEVDLREIISQKRKQNDKFPFAFEEKLKCR